MILNFIRQVLGRAILWVSHLTRPKPMVRSEEDQARAEKEAVCWSARPGSNRRPSAWECDESRETALVFVLEVEIGVFKSS